MALRLPYHILAAWHSKDSIVFRVTQAGSLTSRMILDTSLYPSDPWFFSIMWHNDTYLMDSSEDQRRK